MKQLKWLLLTGFVFVWVIPTWAESMDADTQDGVIHRLERVYKQLPEADASYLASTLRLADLHAERARRIYLAEIEASCEGCQGSKEDRERALELYSKIKNKIVGEQKGLVLLQMSQLNLLKKNDMAAINYLNDLVQNLSGKGHLTKGQDNRSELVSKAEERLGEIYYRKGQYQNAYEHFQKSIKHFQSSNRSQIVYRTAWCKFNLGQFTAATNILEGLLVDSRKLTRQGTDGQQYDPVLHGDIVADLALFYTKQKMSQREISKYVSYIPVGRERELMLHFIKESERLAARQAALWMLEKYYQLNLSPVEKLEADMRGARIAYGLNHDSESASRFSRIAEAWKTQGCQDPDLCKQIKMQMRNFVLEFHKGHKINLNKEVLRLYSIYSDLFVDDIQMSLTGAQIARELKNYNVGLLLFHQTASVAFKALNQLKQEEAGPDHSQAQSILDKALEGEIEIAESSNQPDLREKAYLFFLKLRPADPKAYGVRYQLAHVKYERKEYSQAADDFHELALTHVRTSTDLDLKKKAADLSLDALVILKRHQDIELWATQYTHEIRQGRLEYAQIARKASINLVTQMAKSERADTNELKKAFTKSRTTLLLGASQDEIYKILETQFLLARRIPDLVSAQIVLGEILKLPKLSKYQREEALLKKVWLHEMRFEFREAYRVAKSIPARLGKDLAEAELRLATLAELAGINPELHYLGYLRLKPRGQKSAVIRGHVVEISKNQEKSFRQHSEFLLEYPVIYGDLALAIFYRKLSGESDELAKLGLKSSTLRHSQSGLVLLRLQTMKEIARFAKKLQNIRLAKGSDKKVQGSIKERLNLLAKADDYVKLSSVEAGLQLMALSIVARENRRLYEDILSSPLPKGLRKNQKEVYQNMLKTQANSFIQKSQLAAEKVNEIWRHSHVFENFAKEMDLANQKTIFIVTYQINLLSSVIVDEYRSQLKEILIAQAGHVSRKDVANLRDQARKDPFNTDTIEKLKKVESKMGNEVMVGYLDSRLKSIQND